VLPRQICATKGVRINRKEPQKLWSTWAQPPCGRGVGDPFEINLSHMGYPAEFGRSRSNGTSVIKEIRLKNLTLVCCLSRSLKVVGTDKKCSIATMDLLVLFPR